MVEVQRLNGGAEALGTSARDGVAFLAHATRQGARERVPEEAPDLGSISREQSRAEAVQVIEHRPVS